MRGSDLQYTIQYMLHARLIICALEIKYRKEGGEYYVVLTASGVV